jgi:adenylate cyclase
MTDEGFKRKLTAILSADVEGYSRLMADDEEATVRTLTTYREVMTTLIQQHNGKVLDSPGDNLLAEFASVVDAVQCAVSVQKEINSRNTELPEDRRMQFRIGINLGDVIQEEDRIYGDGVNIAARLEGLSDPGGICISKTAFDHIESKLPYGYEYLGDQTVKNIPKPVGAYKVLLEPRVTVAGMPEKRVVSRRMPILVGAVAVIFLAVAAGIWYFFMLPTQPPIETASVEKMAYPLPDKPSIAVLPFDNLSGDPEQDYIADGITDNIITALSYIPQMFVIARNSSFTYKGKAVKVQQVSEELGVRYILEGSVLKSGEKVRITAQLIDALTGGHMWSERYDRDFKDFFDLLDEITQAVTVALQVKLTDGEQARLWYGSTRNFEAWGHVVKGMGIFYHYTPEAMVKSRDLFEKALAIDPEYAHAATMLSATHIIDFRFGYTDSRDKSLNSAIEMAKKAVALDDNNPLAHSMWQHIHMIQKQYDKAVEAGRKAVTLGPNDAEVHILLGEALLNSGKFEEAIKMCEKAIRLHPHTPRYYFGHMAKAYYGAGRYEKSLVAAEKHLNMARKTGQKSTQAESHLQSALALMGLDREKEAQEHVAQALKLWPEGSNLDHLRKYSGWSSYKDQILLQHIVDPLHKAGVPEHAPLPLPDKPSIAVLPFDNLSDDPEQEYFSDGMTDDLITDLSKISGLFVIARNSAFKYKGQSVDVKKVSRELGVRYVLEGSVRRYENKIRINAQLIDATTGGHLWAERYDEQMDNIFLLQDKITMKIVEALAVKLTIDEKEAIPKKETNNLKAYLTFLKGWQHYRRFTSDEFLEAIPLLEKAIELDPNYWRAHAVLAKIYLEVSQREGWSLSLGLNRNDVYRRMNKYLEVAMKNPTPLAHGVAVELDVYFGGFEKALTEAEKAVSLDSNDPDSHFAMGYALVSASRHREAVDSFKRAMRLDPFYQDTFGYKLGIAYFFMSQFDKAASLFERAFKSNPENSVPLWYLAAIYGHLGREQEAKATLAKLRELNPNYSYSRYLMYFFKFKDPADFNLLADGLRKAGME